MGETLQANEVIHRKLILSYQKTSLDFPCNFCNSNSYANYHLRLGGHGIINICEDCLKKAKGD